MDHLIMMDLLAPGASVWVVVEIVRCLVCYLSFCSASANNRRPTWLVCIQLLMGKHTQLETNYRCVNSGLAIMSRECQ